MAELDSDARTVVENVALLLQTGNFSDLTLLCQGQKFRVHRAIVCARSPVWAVAAGGSFKEANTRLVEVNIADTPTLRRALAYLYTGTYDDERLLAMHDVPPETGHREQESDAKASGFEPDNAPESVVHIQDAQVRSEADGTVVSSSSRSDTEHTPRESEEVLQSENLSTENNGAAEDIRSCCTVRRKQPDSVCDNERLRANTLVYILADYYQIPDLKQMAMRKFAAALEQVCHQGFAQICRLVYESAPSTALDLRLCLSGAIASHGEQLIEDASFWEAALLLPELLRDAFSILVRQHRVTSSERDGAVAAALEAKDVAREANKQGQEDKERVIARVNNARRCRHCALENNVFFEAEASIFGKSEYSFRCRCRTRY